MGHLKGLEPEINPVGTLLCHYDVAPILTVDIRIPMRFPGCQSSVWCVLSHIHVKKGMISNPSREGQWKFCVWNFSWILPYVLPTSTDFNMYLFNVIDPNHKGGNYQEALCVPLESFWNRVDLGTPPNFR